MPQVARPRRYVVSQIEAFTHRVLSAPERGALLSDYPYVWAWGPSKRRTRLGEIPWGDRALDRKGERCRLIAVGTMHSVLIEFEDGYRVVTDRRGLRKAPPP